MQADGLFREEENKMLWRAFSKECKCHHANIHTCEEFWLQ